MQLRFLGANRQVTGSRYELRVAGLTLLIDCGMFQERPFLDRNWAPLPTPVRDIHCVLLTHAHLDHCGLLPRLTQEGYNRPILCTAPTRDLTRLILEDSARIQLEDADYKRARHEKEHRTGPHPIRPLYTPQDVEQVVPLFQTAEFHTPVSLSPEVSVRFRRAGHILGAASIEVTAKEGSQVQRILFSGDLGPRNRPILEDSDDPLPCDHLVMESTYGRQEHHEADIEAELAKVITSTAAAGGNVVIPTFAIDRAQALLFHLGKLIRSQRIPRLPVFLDSPMAVDATDLFLQHRRFWDDESRAMFNNGEPPLRFPGLSMTRTRDQSRAINNLPSSAIILSPAGMCNAGRIKHHLCQNISRPQSTIVFVGYQSQGTLGRQILDGQNPVRIFNRLWDVKARIHRIQGLSAHADASDLVDWALSLPRPPRNVFLTHGDLPAAQALQSLLLKHDSWQVHIPEYGQTVELA